MRLVPLSPSAMTAACLIGAAVTPTAAFAVDYLSAEQAAKLIFPDADRFAVREFSLGVELMRKLEQRGVRARSARWSVKVAMRDDAVVGFVVVDDVIGKFELISYAVGVGTDGAIRQVEILSYRESHGHEIRLPAWRRQFIGKTSNAPLHTGEDIANISGATLSCSHVTEGVKRIVSVIDLAQREGLLA
nr:FMN-binding domain protein [uncultured bacterium]